MQRYITLTVFISALTGILVGCVLGILGVQFAALFGFLAFLLNFIPNLGAIIATILGLIAGTVFQNADLGLVIASAMVINMLVAALAGILIPLLLDRFGADPAISSSVFTTMATDCIGFLSFLGLATWWLDLG